MVYVIVHLRWGGLNIVDELKRVQTLASEREAELVHTKETLMKVTSEKDQLGFQLKTALSLAERRFTEIEALQGIAFP